MEKVVISSTEVEAVQVVIDPVGPASPKVSKAIPLWAKLVLLPLVLLLPLLCVIAIVIRIALRATDPRTRTAWNAYLNSLLVASGLLFTVGSVLLLTLSPTPPQAISAGMSDLDERTDFPVLPSSQPMSGTAIAENLKPMVMVATPVKRRWFNGGDVSSGLLGAAMLLKADSNGYLFATARHVADGLGWRSGKGIGRVLLSSSVGGWATAQVVGRHKDLDVALLWVPRRSGRGDFYQPIVSSADTHAGEQIYVIGHPEGLNFSIASGLVSRVMPQALQLSAPVSPGNSGGPVYDERGRLLGVVSSKVDRSVDPNAENLSFAVRAVVFASADGWEFEDQGKLQLLDYETKIKMEQTPPGPARNN